MKHLPNNSPHYHPHLLLDRNSLHQYATINDIVPTPLHRTLPPLLPRNTLTRCYHLLLSLRFRYRDAAVHHLVNGKRGSCSPSALKAAAFKTAVDAAAP